MEEEQKTRKSPRRRWLIVGSAALLLCGLAALAVHIVNSPSEGTILRSGTPNRDISAPTPLKSIKTLDTPYYSLSYNSDFQTITQSKDVGELDLRILQSHTKLGNPNAMRVSFVVESIPKTGVQEMPSYKLAHAQPDKYKVENKNFGDDKGYIFTRSGDDNFQIVLWPHGQKVLVISLSPNAQGSVPDYASFTAQVADTLVWKP